MPRDVTEGMVERKRGRRRVRILDSVKEDNSNKEKKSEFIIQGRKDEMKTQDWDGRKRLSFP